MFYLIILFSKWLRSQFMGIWYSLYFPSFVMFPHLSWHTNPNGDVQNSISMVKIMTLEFHTISSSSTIDRFCASGNCNFSVYSFLTGLLWELNYSESAWQIVNAQIKLLLLVVVSFYCIHITPKTERLIKPFITAAWRYHCHQC